MQEIILCVQYGAAVNRYGWCRYIFYVNPDVGIRLWACYVASEHTECADTSKHRLLEEALEL